MGQVVTEESNQLDDDLFAAGFDEGLELKAPEETETVDEVVKEVIEPVAEVAETEVSKEVVEEKVPTVDIKAIVAEALAAARTQVPTPKQEEPQGYQPTPEELAAEEAFKKDWPEHAAREERLKRELAEMKQMLSTTVEKLTGQLAPVLEQNQLSAEERHLNAILSVHKDALEIVPAVQEWVKTQPKFLQPQYEAVLNEGHASDVVDLFTMFKHSTGKPAEDNSVSEKAAEDARKKAENTARLERMKTPTSVRTSVTAEEDPDDFDSAFEQAAKKLAA